MSGPKLTPEVAHAFEKYKNRRKQRQKKNDESTGSSSTPSSNNGDGGNGGELKNIKLTVSYRNVQETLKRRFSGNDCVSAVAEAIADQITGSADSVSRYHYYGKKVGMNLIFGKTPQTMDVRLSSIKNIRGDEQWNQHVHVSFRVIGGADDPNNDKKNDEDRERMADFENEERITPTLEPDCIFGWDDRTTLRVKMPCGHVFDPQTLFQLTKMYVNNLSKSKIYCPVEKCQQVWDFDIVAAAADLDDDEKEKFQAALHSHRVPSDEQKSVSQFCFNETKYTNDKKDDNDKQLLDFSKFCQVKKGNCCGLKTLGNTCFMNSALQCLMHSPYFTHELLGLFAQLTEYEKGVETLPKLAKKEAATKRNKWEAGVEKGERVQLQFEDDICWYDGVVTKIDRYAEQNGHVYVNVTCHGYEYENIPLWAPFIRPNREALDSNNNTDIIDSGNPGILSRLYNAAYYGCEHMINTYSLGDEDNLQGKKFEPKPSNILQEWIYLLNRVHCKGKNVISPKEFRRYLGMENSKFCDGEQHDAWEALLTAISGMESACDRFFLDNKSTIDSIRSVPIELKESAFENDFGKSGASKDDLTWLQSKGYLRTSNAANVVTRHFGSVQVTTNICLNCGFGNRVYEQLNSLEVPIVDECIKLTLLKYDSESTGYIYALNSVNIVANGKIKLAKFYGLYYDKEKKFQDIKQGDCNELDNWDIISVNCNSVDNNKMAIILDDGVRLQRLTRSNNAMIMVPREEILNNKNSSNDLFSIFDTVYFKLVVCYALSFDLTKTFKNNRHQGKKNGESLYFSVLKIPRSKNESWNYEGLVEALSNTKQYQSIAKLLKGTKYSLIIDIGDGLKYHERIRNIRDLPISLNESTGNIFCMLKKSSIFDAECNRKRKMVQKCKNKKKVLKKFNHNGLLCQQAADDLVGDSKSSNHKWLINQLDRQINHLKVAINDNSIQNDSGTLPVLNDQLDMCKNYKSLFQLQLSDHNMVVTTMRQFKSSHGIYGNPFVKMTKLPLRNIKNCIDLYYQVSYLSSSTFEIKCQCTKLGYGFKYAPIVYTKKKLLNSPKILVLKFDRGDTTIDKISHRVKFDTTLESQQFLNEKYSLFGVSYHRGSNVGGHYTACVKRLGTEKDWRICNDEKVYRCTNYFDFCGSAMFVCFAKE